MLTHQPWPGHRCRLLSAGKSGFVLPVPCHGRAGIAGRAGQPQPCPVTAQLSHLHPAQPRATIKSFNGFICNALKIHSMLRVGLWRGHREPNVLPTPSHGCLLHLQPHGHAMASKDVLPTVTPDPSPGGTWRAPRLSQSCIPVLPPGSRRWVIPTSRSVQGVFVASRGSHLRAPWGRTGPAPSFPLHIHGCRWGGLWPVRLGFAFKPHPLPSAELSGVKNGLLLPGQELLVRGRFLN